MNPANDNRFFTTQRLMKFGTALALDLLKFIFGIMLLLAPIIAGALIGNVAEGACHRNIPTWVPGQGLVCNVAGKAVTVVVAGAGYFLEFGTGVGAAAVEFISQIFEDAIDVMAWVLFTIWFMVSGVKFWGGKRATSKFLIAGASAGAGIVPFINLFPTITVGVVGVEWNQYKEDLEKARSKAPQLAREEQVATQQEMAAVARQRALEEQERAYAEMMLQAANDDEAAANEDTRAA